MGRDSELAQLQHGLEKACSGERQLIFITGEAGIGKTRVLQTFLDRIVPESGAWIGLGQCVEQYGAGEAYMPVLEALGRVCRHNPQLVTILERHAPSWLIQMPSVLETAALEALQPRVIGITQERMLREMAETVEVLTAQHSLVIALEDLHWSDHSTLALISYLTLRREPARLLLVGTHRPVDAVMSDRSLTG